MFILGKFHKGLDVFRASAATAGVFEPKLGFDLAWHHDARTCRVADIRISNSLAQAQIHIASLGKNDYEKHYQYATTGGICQQGARFEQKEPHCPLLTAHLEGGFELTNHVFDGGESRLPEGFQGDIDVHGSENALW